MAGDNTPDTRTIRDANIIVTTPEKWDGISRSWQTRDYVRRVSLVIIDEIHLLAGDRGPVLEIIVSRMNYIGRSTKNPIRILGMSTACANAQDLADWLSIDRRGPNLFNFRHSVRPVPLSIFIDGFPETKGFCPLMQSMNRPTFLAIKSHSPEKPVIVFVPSRRQTRLTAKDLINLCGMEDNPRRFLHMDEDDLQLNLLRVKDDALKEALNFGIGLHHAGLVESDRQLAEELFLNNKIQILVATSTLAWGVNLPAHLVVVKGTQFYDAKTQGYKDMDLTDVLQMLGRAGRPQFDNSAVARIFTQNAKKDFYKHFLHTGFPVESSLHKVLDDHLCAEISAGTIKNMQDALDYLACTFFFRRLHKNPSYYGLDISPDDDEHTAHEMGKEFIVGMVKKSIDELATSQCVEITDGFHVRATPFGKFMSYYYLSHKTIRYLYRHATQNPSLHDVLSWISRATEYDELPVRHNEDLLNDDLSRRLPLPLPTFGLPMWDPHVKAFLLLQAHMSRTPLPISDYVGDQTSVLDQAIRIIQASTDVVTEMGHLHASLALIQLLQCVKSARWPADAPARILPGVPDNCSDATPSLQAIAAMTSKQVSDLGRKLGVPSSHGPQFAKAASMLPNLDVKVDEAAAPQSAITVHLKRLNPLGERDARIWAPRWPKPQTEGWFVLLAQREEVLALKRVGWFAGDGKGGRGLGVGSRPSAKVTLNLPREVSGKVDVIVASDSYIALEYRIQGVAVSS
jgi:antiviral helicase SLH1